MSSLDFFKRILESDPKATSTSVTPFSYLIETGSHKIHFVRTEHYEESSFQMASRILSTNHPGLIVVLEKYYIVQPDKVFNAIFK